MKTTLLLVALFAILFVVYADNQCQRCETLVHNSRVFCEKERGCTLDSYEKFLEPLCNRISEPKEHQHCLNDLEHVSSVWEHARTNMTVRQVCAEAELCSADHSIDWYLEHEGFSSFVEFKRKFQKKYASVEEEIMRAKFFLQNLEYIENLNKFAKERKSSAKFGINKFADLSRTEFKTRVLSKVAAKVDPEAPYAPKYEEEHVEALPTSFDWRTKGAVTPVKNQGQCGSCWSFSATGNMEGQWFLSGHTLVGLSEQNLVDCDHECMMYDGEKSCDAGCNGGLQPNAFTYVIKTGGIDSEASYPYTAANGVCRFNKTNIAASIKNYTMVGKEESQMQAYLVDHGPLAIAADAVEWQFYVGGVFDFPCGTSLDHGILITGYGVEKDVLGTYPYWWIKNSWGPDWGDQGYMKLYRGDGLCGCNLFVSSSIV